MPDYLDLPLFSDQPETKEIPLTKGLVAIVDAADYEWLSQFKWHATRHGNEWYAARSPRIDKKPRTVYMHREVFGDSAAFNIDHIDGDGLNNTRRNLRVASREQNLQNRRIASHNTSGYKGVSLRKDNGKYQAQIVCQRKVVYLGCFDTAIDAAMAYDNAASELHGEFARLNFK